MYSISPGSSQIELGSKFNLSWWLRTIEFKAGGPLNITFLDKHFLKALRPSMADSLDVDGKDRTFKHYNDGIDEVPNDGLEQKYLIWVLIEQKWSFMTRVTNT